jgi:inner membrane protein
MASIGHVALGLAGARLYDQRLTPRWSAFTGMVVWSGVSMLPDIDVIGFRLGVAYEAPWGHRGATHSFAFAGLVALVAYLVARAGKLPALTSALLVAALMASHGLLDTMTDGGLGCALFWPFSQRRFFAPWTPIPVAPIGLDFFSAEGLHVAAVETVLFIVPLLYGLWPRRRRSVDPPPPG